MQEELGPGCKTRKCGKEPPWRSGGLLSAVHKESILVILKRRMAEEALIDTDMGVLAELMEDGTDFFFTDQAR
jgi:hypothetical protein